MENLNQSNYFQRMQKLIEQKSKNEVSKRYNCEICKDTGQLPVKKMFQLNNGDTQELTLFDGPMCECRKRANFEKVLKNSGLGERIKNNTFESFIADNKELVLNKKLAKYWAKHLPTKNIILAGQSGSGKTHLAFSIAKELVDNHGIIPKMSRYTDILEQSRNTGFDKVMRANFLNQYIEPECLILDDLFKARINKEDHRLIFDILDQRYNQDKMNIITTEYLINDLGKEYEAIYSRLIEKTGDKQEFMLLFKNTGNRRLEVNQKEKMESIARLLKEDE